jgi:hypothetical protein
MEEAYNVKTSPFKACLRIYCLSPTYASSSNGFNKKIFFKKKHD